MTIYYQDDQTTVYHGDCIEVMRNMPENSVDAIVTDPPYGLGFMGAKWDALPPGKDWAEECLRVLKPGGHLLAFGGTRTWHRLAVAIEDAGFEIRDSVMWLYGSGFPKSHDVSKAIDKAGGDALAFRRFARAYSTAVEASDLTHADIDRQLGIKSSSCYWAREDHRGGMPPRHHWETVRGLLGLDAELSRLYDEAEREVIGTKKSGIAVPGELGHYTVGGSRAVEVDITAPATDAAKQWSGWGTALKPATEPVVWARKPFNLVPLNSEVNRLHHLIGGLVWLSLSPAKRAELTSTSNPVEQHGATCVSALVSAAMDTSRAESAKTDTFNSQAAASTSWSIASSWSAILDALSAQTRTSTTATKSSTTTGLKTLNSLLGPITSQTTMPACECLTGGPRSTAQNAESSSSDAWMNWLDTLSASVPETATEGIALAAASALASIAEELSAGQEAERTAGESATTRAAASNGGLTEPIVMARKPFKLTVAANVLEHGTGAINIDACRIEGEANRPMPQTPRGGILRLGGCHTEAELRALAEAGEKTPNGETATLVLARFIAARERYDPSGEKTTNAGRWPANVILDEHMAGVLDQQSGESVSKRAERGAGKGATATYGEWGTLEDTTRGHNDSGGASRFFYVAKAPKRERPEANGVKHTTVKPLTLMRYLVRMVTPPNGTVLDPFAGSGTTIEAALLEGFQSIGIELTDEYLPLIQQRIQRQWGLL